MSKKKKIRTKMGFRGQTTFSINHLFVRCHESRQNNFHESFNAERHVLSFCQFPPVRCVAGVFDMFVRVDFAIKLLFDLHENVTYA